MSGSQRFGSLVTEALSYQRHLVLELDAELLPHSPLCFCLQRRDIGCGSTTCINKEVAVLFRELRATNLIAAHADAIDELPGRMLRRILEERPGIATSRLGLEPAAVVVGDARTQL